MGYKEEWEEIEKEIKEADNKKLEKYKMGSIPEELKDFEVRPNSKKKKVFKIGKKILKIVFILFAIWLLHKLYIVMYISFSNMKNAYDIDVKNTIETSYNVKIDLISKKVDERENIR